MAVITLITLGVSDLARATAFYEALGWRRSSASVEGTVAFFHGTPVLALWGREELAADAGLPVPSPGAPPAISLAVNLAGEDQVDALLRAARDAGGQLTKPAERTDWGGYSGYFSDPDGHLWEVAYNPGFALNPDGTMTLPD